MKDVTEDLSSYWLKVVYYNNLKVFQSNLELIRRVDRAYDMLVRDNRYTIALVTQEPLTFQVTNPDGKEYFVMPGRHTCTCPDALRQMLCKHRLAIKMILECKGLQQ